MVKTTPTNMPSPCYSHFLFSKVDQYNSYYNYTIILFLGYSSVTVSEYILQRADPPENPLLCQLTAIFKTSKLR